MGKGTPLIIFQIPAIQGKVMYLLILGIMYSTQNIIALYIGRQEKICNFHNNNNVTCNVKVIFNRIN